MHPTTLRPPSGTRTRAPLCTRTPAGARYVSRPNPGTGTATLTSRSVGAGEEVTHFLHVFPDVPFALGTAQQVGRVKRRDDDRTMMKRNHLPAQARDGRVDLQQRMRRVGAERDDDAR